MNDVTIARIKKYPYIDALRGIAIIMVIASHAGFCTGCANKTIVESIQLYASRGVLLFFVVSSLTLFMSLEQRARLERRAFFYFFIRRFFRIAPLFYIVMLYYLWDSRYLIGDYGGISIADIISSLTFTSWVSPYWFNSVVNPIGWTISVEMTFYALIPFLYKKITNLNRALWISLAASYIVQLTKTRLLTLPAPIPDQSLWMDWLGYYFPEQFPVFLLGVVLYFCIKRGMDETGEMSRKGKISNFFLLIAGIALTFGVSFPGVLSSVFVFSIGLTLFCFVLSQKPSIFFVNRFTIFIGKISFSLYLVHSIVIRLFDTYGIWIEWQGHPLFNYLSKILISLFASAVIATITFKLIEQPGQKFGKKIIIWLEKRQMRIADKAKALEANLSEVGS